MGNAAIGYSKMTVAGLEAVIVETEAVERIPGVSGSNGRTGQGTVTGQTLSIVLRDQTDLIAPTVPAAGETGRTGVAFPPL